MAISAEFTADFSQFNAAAAEAQTSITNVAVAAESLDVEAQARKAGAAFTTLAGEVTNFAAEYIGAYAEEEAATARLVTALQNQGTASTEVITAYQNMAAEFQNTTRYADDAVLSAQTLFTQIAHLGPEQMQPAIQAAANLAASLKITLPQAAQLMGAAIESGGAKLGKLNKYFDDTELKGKSAAEMIEAFNQKFAGAAQADMETTTGKLDALNNKFDDFKGKVGEALATALTPLLDAFMQLSPTVQTLILGVGGLVVALAPIALAFGAFVTAVAPLVALIGGAGGLIALIGTIGGVLATLAVPLGIVAAAVTAVYLAWKYWDQIVDFCKMVYDAVQRYIVQGVTAYFNVLKKEVDLVVASFKWLYDKVVGHSYVPDLIDGIGHEFGKLQQTMVEPADAAVNAVLSSFNRLSHNAMLLATDAGGVAHDAFGRPVVPGGAISALPASLGQQNWTINVNGSVLSTEDQLALVVGNAVSGAYRRGGNRQPV